MPNLPKIAVYSGEIPSTTFIERLIDGLSKQACSVCLFGAISKPTTYNGLVKNYGYFQNRFYKLFYLLKYSLLLSIFKPTQKKQFKRFLKAQQRDDLYSKVKYYPVLYYKPDIFHLQWAKGIAEWAWVEDFGIKLVLSLRGAHINYSPIADQHLAETYKYQFPKVSGFHAVSRAIANEAVKYGATLDKTHVVHSGLSKVDMQSGKKDKNKVFQMISVGRPHWIKGYTLALDACKHLKDLGVAFFYTFMGGANDMELMYQINDLELQDFVSLIDKQSFESVQLMMQNADLLIVSSHKEGIANVALEAMALNTLVLTTNCGGMDEVIEDGKNGFMVPIRDAEQMAQKIRLIMSLGDEEKSRISDNALLTIESQHTEEKMVDGMMELYDEVMGMSK